MTARSRGARELVEQLRALEQRARTARRRAGRAYSRREVSQALGKPPYNRAVDNQRISAWVPLTADRDPQVPSDRSSDDVVALVRLWSSWAGEVLNERDWRDLLERAQPARSLRATPARPGRPVREVTDPFALEVHEAIDGGGAPELPLLPLYARRRHDRWLSGVVDGVTGQGAGEPTSALAVLVGESSTGKTRACWETLGLLPPDWRLVYPLVPSPAEALLAALDGIAPRTVLWLDEIHRFLGGDRGEQAAARLREVLADPRRGPLLALGTTWPVLWRDLVKPRRVGDRRDPHAQARALLTGRHHRVPDTFEGADLPELRRLAAADLRLQEALAHGEQGQITQYLAGGRALVDRYETATALQRALIESAMDARRLGHDTALPQLLLEAALRGYLTRHQYDMVADGDIEHALAELAEPSHGARGPLTPVTLREPGRPRLTTDKVRLADYLDQYGRKERHAQAPPAGLWDALTDHAAGESLTALAESARERGHLRIALRLLAAATEAGVPGAALSASRLLEGVGRHDEALLWSLPLAEAGDPQAMVQTAGLMEKPRRAEAVAWYERAAEAGHHNGWLYAGMLQHQAGEHLDAEACYRRAIAAGVTSGHGSLAYLLDRVGRTEEAFAHHRQEAEANGGYAVMQTAALMRERGDSGAAVLSWLLPRVAEEDGKDGPRIPWAWGALLKHLAVDATLRHRLRSLVDQEAQDDPVRGELTAVLDQAEELAKGDQARGPSVADAPGQQQGRPDQRPAGAEVLHTTRHMNEALDRLRRAAHAGDPDAWHQYAELLRSAGRTEDARRMLRYGWEPDGEISQPWSAAPSAVGHVRASGA
ncbi:hypothetical protein [Streptomyces sp. NPDC059063]|uniref:hypothetical protein n=1 Tax=unclassified Streptomyces TaxID=2593676 RepID=UPI00368CA7BC